MAMTDAVPWFWSVEARAIRRQSRTPSPVVVAPVVAAGDGGIHRPGTLTWGTPGCTPACRRDRVVVVGRRSLEWREYHDPSSHEQYGASQTRAAITVMAPANRVVQSAAHGLVIDLANHCATVRGRHVNATANEWSILASLARRPGELVEAATLIAETWRDTPRVPTERHMLRVNVTRLRGRLGEAAACLETMVGQGYLLRVGPLKQEPSP